MSSLITKSNKSRSPASQKVRTTKAKKVADKKPQRPGKITAAPKAKKAAPAKSKKPASPAKKPLAATSNKATPKKVVKAAPKPAKKLTAKKPTAKTPPRRAAAKRAAAPAPPAKAVQPQPKKTPPATLLAVKAFEQALRLFNRHDYSGAKEAFTGLLTRFGDQTDIVAPARTYIAICDQRMARTPTLPRTPDALYDQGVVQLNKGNSAEAIALFEKALKAEPRADYVWYSLAAALMRIHQPSKGLDALRRAISLRPVHRPHARRDLDFASLRDNEEFQQLTGFGFDFDEE